MAENQFPSTVDALLKGMDNFITTKTVVGEPLKVEDAVIIPLMDVSCGMGAGSYVQNSKANTRPAVHRTVAARIRPRIWTSPSRIFSSNSGISVKLLA